MTIRKPREEFTRNQRLAIIERAEWKCEECRRDLRSPAEKRRLGSLQTCSRYALTYAPHKDVFMWLGPMVKRQGQLRDGDIRRPLHDWLVESHSHDPDTGIIHELKMPRPSARVDIAVVNGEIAGFEIKSDVDSLKRLPHQVVAFSRYFDRVCVVTTARHATSVRQLVPTWWGILLPIVTDRDCSFEPLQSLGINPSIDSAALLYSLTCRELNSMLAGFGIGDISGQQKSGLIARALNELDPVACRTSARHALRQRSMTMTLVCAYPDNKTRIQVASNIPDIVRAYIPQWEQLLFVETNGGRGKDHGKKS